MKIIILLYLIVSTNDVAKINKLKKEAERYFFEKNYELAINKYSYLLDSMNIKDDKVQLNLSHSYLLNNDTIKAIDGYNLLSSSKNNKIKSIAYQQLGVISDKHNKLEESLELFKNSIKANSLNTESKYNYELVTKRIKEQQNKEQQNKEQQNKEQQNKEQQNKEQQNKKKEKNKNEVEKSIEEKLKEINLSKEKAEMILEALKNNEVQYLQQLKRKTSKKVDKSKPDW